MHAPLGYTSVRRLTYRNRLAPWDFYTSRGVGIGHNLPDHDQLLPRAEYRPRIDWSCLTRHRTSGRVERFRQAFPADSVPARLGMGFLLSPVDHLP